MFGYSYLTQFKKVILPTAWLLARPGQLLAGLGWLRLAAESPVAPAVPPGSPPGLLGASSGELGGARGELGASSGELGAIPELLGASSGELGTARGEPSRRFWKMLGAPARWFRV